MEQTEVGVYNCQTKKQNLKTQSTTFIDQLKFNKNDSFNDIISKLLDEYEEYQGIKDLIEADKEFANGEGVHFSSLDELDAYLDD